MPDNASDALAASRYFDRSFQTSAVKVLPGEYYVTASDLLMVTVLGSCVAACIRDSGNGIGGMNHFMLPDGGADETSPASTSARYGSYAMEVLINQIVKLGARRAHLEAKVFGGGNVMAGLTIANVGERNADFVLGFLDTENIRIAAHDLNDVFPRKVFYFPATGRVLVKKLRNMHNPSVVERETSYRSRLRQADVGGEVELFG